MSARQIVTPELRATLVAQWRGQPGLTGAGREEQVIYQTGDDGEPEVIVSTTRPATAADLLDSARPVTWVQEQGDYIRLRLPGGEYRPGGVLGSLRRHSTMSEEDRAAAGARLAAVRGGGAS